MGPRMKLQIRNPVAVHVNPAEDQSGVTLHFVTASEHEAVVVVPNALILGLTNRLRILSSQLDRSVTASAEPNLISAAVKVQAR